MKTLHVGNVANISTALKKDNDSNIMVSRNTFDYLCDYYYIIGNNNLTRSFFNCIKLLTLELKYDMIHSHVRRIPFDIDLIICALLGKKIIIHYHGSDIRNKRQPIIHRLISNTFYVSTPDLLKFVPSADWLPNPYKITKEVSEYHKHDPIRILHAPSNRDTKGTREVLIAIYKLKYEGYKIDFRLIENKSHEIILQQIDECDIILDQFKVGWYGMITCEAMEAGKPVICYIDKKYIPENINIPIINTSEFDLYSTLKNIISMPENELANIGISGRKYLEEVHGNAQFS